MKAASVLGVVVAALVAGVLAGQEQPAPKAAPSKWGGLGLSDEQKQKVYKIQAEYEPKIAPLQKQLDEVTKKLAAFRAEERAELEKVLTEEQKKRLRDLVSDKSPAESKKP